MSIEIKTEVLAPHVQFIDEPEDKRYPRTAQHILSAGDVITGHDGTRFAIQGDEHFLTNEQAAEDFMLRLTGRRWDIVPDARSSTYRHAYIYSGKIAEGQENTWAGINTFEKNELDFKDADFDKMWGILPTQIKAECPSNETLKNCESFYSDRHSGLMNDVKKYHTTLQELDRALWKLEKDFTAGKDTGASDMGYILTLEESVQKLADKISTDWKKYSETDWRIEKDIPAFINGPALDRNTGSLKIPTEVLTQSKLVETYEDYDNNGYLSEGDYIATWNNQIYVNENNIKDEQHLKSFLETILNKKVEFIFSDNAADLQVYGMLLADRSTTSNEFPPIHEIILFQGAQWLQLDKNDLAYTKDSDELPTIQPEVHTKTKEIIKAYAPAITKALATSQAWEDRKKAEDYLAKINTAFYDGEVRLGNIQELFRLMAEKETQED